METKRHEEEIRQDLASIQRQLLLLLPSTLETKSSGTDAVPTPSNTVKYTTMHNMNDQHIRGRARYATPTAGSDSSNDPHDDEDNHSITIVSSDKMAIVTPSTHLQSRLATRESFNEQEQVNSITIPTSSSVESPLASPKRHSKERDHLSIMESTEGRQSGNHQTRKRECDSESSEHSELFKRQRNNNSDLDDDDDDDDMNSSNSNYYSYNHEES
jgi:hypothetical protein